jgi:beta-galactosidase/beta-glucuronidase
MKSFNWFILMAGLETLTINATAAWQPAQGPLMTRWAKDVKPDQALPEYPRPQMVRAEWQNLNGLWNYAVVTKDSAQPAQWAGQILVPFPIESALSGVMKPLSPDQRLWYRRAFNVPKKWKDKRVLLHFGAVDWETTVFINGRKLGTHRGGYDGFSFDITDALKPSGGQEIAVAVWDPTDDGPQARGKQVRHPNSIWYTSTSGIWQTVWLEPVAAEHLDSLRITPDFDNSTVTIEATLVSGKETNAPVLQFDAVAGRTIVSSAKSSFGTTVPPPPGTRLKTEVSLRLPDVKPWSPDAPFLYRLRVTVLHDGKCVDAVKSYFGMRKISVSPDAGGTPRLCLNNNPLFLFGPLDQGFWPDGIYTAPTDEALRYDIETIKKLGFNMARKHVKVEPDRWYYWADKLGLLVWQDMPSSNVGDNRTDKIRAGNEDAAKQFETELKALVEGRGNHPSIVMWVPFNEGWGQYDTARIAEMVKQLDPSRLVDNASGWTDHGAGDVSDIHHYPTPAVPTLETNRAAVLGEFGGLGLPVRGHTWQAEKNWGYQSFTNSTALTAAYLELVEKLRPLAGKPGLAAAVYTQTTDCEIEVNGLMTYDRAVVKMDALKIANANRKICLPAP